MATAISQINHSLKQKGDFKCVNYANERRQDKDSVQRTEPMNSFPLCEPSCCDGATKSLKGCVQPL